MGTPRFTNPPPGPAGLRPEWASPLPAHAAARVPKTWEYPRCFVLRVHDADTIIVDMDLGQQFWIRDRAVRLIGCACRELSEPGGQEATAFVAELCPLGSMLRIVSHDWDKYGGRILGVVYLPDGRVLQSVLIGEGWAMPWNGHGQQPKPPWPRQRPAAHAHLDEPDS